MKLQRVICLYRVSTKKQVDKNENDIPMQKTACWDFASSKPDWTIVKEYSEKGISGYKVSADDRDAIQELKEAALKDELQQRFDSHVDKLMNYLRFWQASGESEKTSMRIKSKMQQMMEDGLYTGGPVKYGYHLIDSGLVNRKGIPIKKYAVDAVESEVLHMIDDMTIHKGYGSHRLSRYLNENGYKTHTGGKFTSTIVNRILKDRFYCGYQEDGTTTEALQALRIRSDETYAKILEILEQRNNANEEKRHIALQTKGQAMLSGNIFCAHCGGRLTTIRYRDHYTRADGSEYSVDQIKYSCYHKSRKLCKCDGQTTYQALQVRRPDYISGGPGG